VSYTRPMRLAILADIHGNVLALQAVHADLARRNIDRVVNLGDCVSGPLWPRETAALLMRLGWPTVRGNHDRWVIEHAPDKQYPSDAFAYQRLDADHLAWLRALPATLDLGDGILALHGRPGDDNAYLIEDIESGRLVPARREHILARLAGFAGSIVLCAHSHLPWVVCVAPQRTVINPGSVGCPAYEDPTPPAPHVSQAGSPHARYAILQLDDGRASVEHIAIAYDHGAAARCAEANARPDWAHALATGYARGSFA
jgi:predicted phosphodiesterase